MDLSIPRGLGYGLGVAVSCDSHLACFGEHVLTAPHCMLHPPPRGGVPKFSFSELPHVEKSSDSTLTYFSSSPTFTSCN